MARLKRLGPLLAVSPLLFFLASTLLYFSPYVLSATDAVQRSKLSYLADYSTETGIAILAATLCILVAIPFYPRRQVDVSAHRVGWSEPTIMLALLTSLGVYVLSTPELFDVEKSYVLESTDRFHLAFYALCPIGLVAGYIAGWRENKLLIASSFAGLLVILYIGHRSALAITIIALIYAKYRNTSLLAIKRTHIAIGLLALLFLALYKSVYTAIKLGNFEVVLDRLVVDNFWDSALIGFEQFVTFKHLDYIVTHDFRLDCTNLPWIPISIVPFTDNFIDVLECDYNAQVQPIFFPEFGGGVAANIWAEFFANFGYTGFPILVVLVATFCWLIERVMQGIQSPVLKAGLITALVHLTFYIQRKDFFGAFGSAKRAILVALAVFLVAYVWQRLAGRRRPLRVTQTMRSPVTANTQRSPRDVVTDSSIVSLPRQQN